jgi:SAM-dependent methyltransferase
MMISSPEARPATRGGGVSSSLRQLRELRLGRRLQARWDRMRGLDFLSITEPEAVGLDAGLVHRSAPSGNSFLVAVLRDLAVTSGDQVIDVGCGKGSALRVMRRFPFGRVAGIELSDELARIAERNFRRLRARNVEIHAGDASEFEGYGPFNIVYFYNPFPDVVMSRVLDRMNSAWAGSRVERVIIYNNPSCHALLAGRGFHAIRDYPDEWGNGIRVYSTLLPGSARITGHLRGTA